jgi:hypothetical protein
MLTNKRVEGKGEKNIIIHTTRCEKQCFTVILIITVDGRMLPLYVIFKRKILPSQGTEWYSCVQGKGQMGAPMVCDSFDTVWGQKPGTLLQQPSLLVWDSFRGHLGDDTRRILTEMKTDLTVISGGVNFNLTVILCVS